MDSALPKLEKMTCLQKNKFDLMHNENITENINIHGYVIKNGELFYSPNFQILCKSK